MEELELILYRGMGWEDRGGGRFPSIIPRCVC